ncbi:MAG: N-acetylneuraminate synthase family protein [Chloroflexi bacterium]|nr:N-acetylneuraminate synthase family protein [Chloroflexota bacterium]
MWHKNGHQEEPKVVRIGDRLVGDGQPCFVIAEGGVNHNGSEELAGRLIRIAAEARADAVKFQKRSVRDILTRAALERPYLSPNSFGSTYGEHRQKLELDEEVWWRLKELTQDLGLVFLGSAWDKRSGDFLDELGVPAFKVASADLTNLDLLEHLARKGKPMLVSTGMSTMAEVAEAVACVRRCNDQLVLLQCTSTYPSSFDEVNLRVMRTYREAFDVLVGYSGHERGIAVSEAAATLGACVIERHFTVDRTLPGPDHAASLEPLGLQKLVRDIRNIERALGSATKTIMPSEQPVRERLAKSVVARAGIPAGTVITEDMLALKGPGNGIPANRLRHVVGRIAPIDVPEDTLIPKDALDWQTHAT